MKEITGLHEISDLYDAFIIDIWGVIHNGIEPYPKVIACLNELISRKKEIIFLSNAPRPSNIILEKLISLGVPANLDCVITSGDLTRNVIKTYIKPIYHLGAARNQDILSGLNLALVDSLSEASLLLITAYLDIGEDLEQYDAILKEAYTLKLPAICANPDKEVMHGESVRYCSGFLAEKYENLGGNVKYYGKPHLDIYENIFKELKNKKNIDKKRVLMIGDNLETDIKGASESNIDSALVLTGNMNTLLLKNIQKPIEPMPFLTKYFAESNIYPNWVLLSLVW